MPDPHDIRFGRIAIASGLVSPEQLVKGMQQVEAAPERGLPAVLVELGILSADQVQAIRGIQALSGGGDGGAGSSPALPPVRPAATTRPAPAPAGPPTTTSSPTAVAAPAPASSGHNVSALSVSGLRAAPGRPDASAVLPAPPAAASPTPSPVPVLHAASFGAPTRTSPAPAAPATPAPLAFDPGFLEIVSDGGSSRPVPLRTPPGPSAPSGMSPIQTPGIAPGSSGGGAIGREPTRPMSLFGKLILRRGWATEAQVTEALRLQQESELAGKARQVGEILVERGVLSVNQVKELLAEQNKAILKCEGCGTKYNVTGLEPGRTIKCMKCGANLVVPKRIVSPGVEGSVHLHPVGDPLLGKVLGGCKILSKLGKGGMASVYRAKHLGLDKMYAVKILPPASAENSELITRFVSEARAMAKIQHPNIVQVHNVAREQGYNFIVMDLIEGRTLTDTLAESGRIVADEAQRIVAEVARGLAVAHKHGIIHRDVKPDNIMISAKGEVKVMDFGLAQDVQPSASAKTVAGNVGAMIAGTPYYMSPEHWTGKNVDARSDIYSLGVAFYFILTGHKPFVANETLQLMQMHAKQKPESPRKYSDSLSDGLCAVVLKMIAKKPADRYQTGEELVKDLERIKSGLEPLAARGLGGPTLECDFCNTLNPATARKCSVCGEYLNKQTGEIDVLLMDDEFHCPKCKNVEKRGDAECSKCGSAFCPHCQVAIAVLEGYCKACHAKLPPPPPSGTHMRRRR
ncbi:MAG: protein kinase [Planctomycetes bacterium]|nr:protein kinase [Planctomycetota bacterium]